MVKECPAVCRIKTTGSFPVPIRITGAAAFPVPYLQPDAYSQETNDVPAEPFHPHGYPRSNYPGICSLPKPFAYSDFMRHNFQSKRHIIISVPLSGIQPRQSVPQKMTLRVIFPFPSQHESPLPDGHANNKNRHRQFYIK